MPFCTSPILYKSDRPPQKNDVMSIFKMVDLRHLGFYGSNNGFVQKPCTTSCRSSVETIALNCLVFWENRVLVFWRQTDKLKPGTHWRQSWIQHGRICWKSTKSTVSLWPRTQQSRPYRQQSYQQQSRPRQDVEFTLLPICCQYRQQSRPHVADLLPVDFASWIQLCRQCIPCLADKQMDKPIALSHSPCRERRLNN